MIAGISRILHSTPSALEKVCTDDRLAVTCIAIELFERFRLMRSVEASPELRVYKRVEMLTTAALLGLTAYCSKRGFDNGIGVITLFAMERLYQTSTTFPQWVKLFKGEWDLKPPLPNSFHFACMVMNMCFIVPIYQSIHVLACQHFRRAAAGATLLCLMSIGARVLTHHILSRYLQTEYDGSVAVLSIERLLSFIHMLDTLTLTHILGCLSALGMKGLAMARKVLYPVVDVGTFSFQATTVMLICVRLLIARKLTVSDILLAVESPERSTLEIVKSGARKLLSGTMDIIHSTRLNVWMPSQVAASFYAGDANDLAEWTTGEERIKTIFRNLVPLIRRFKTIDFVAKYRLILTPEVLSSDTRLWAFFTAGQIRSYLLTPELKTLSEGDSFNHLEEQVDALTQKIKALEHEKDPLQKYHQLRLLYAPLEAVRSADLSALLKKLPNNPDPEAQQLIDRLKNSAASVEALNARISDVEDQLEASIGDLFKYAYESLPAMGGKDLNALFEAWGQKQESSPFTRIQTLLAAKGIVWKGDLIHAGIVQAGDNPDNSVEALKDRLTALLNQKQSNN